MAARSRALRANRNPRRQNQTVPPTFSALPVVSPGRPPFYKGAHGRVVRVEGTRVQAGFAIWTTPWHSGSWDQETPGVPEACWTQWALGCWDGDSPPLESQEYVEEHQENFGQHLGVAWRDHLCRGRSAGLAAQREVDGFVGLQLSLLPLAPPQPALPPHRGPAP